MENWRKEFQYLLDRKILSADELAYLFGQIRSIIIAVQLAEAEGTSKGRPLCPDCRDLCLEAATKDLRTQLAEAAGEVERLKGICLRESMVLQEALKRPKNNKSMIAVVAASLAEQAKENEDGKRK